MNDPQDSIADGFRRQHVPTGDDNPSSIGTHVQVFQSPLVTTSRLFKIARSIHASGLFTGTELVGIQSGELPEREDIAPGVEIVRVRGTRRTGNFGRVLKALLWQPRVFLAYRRRSLAVVSAHNVWVLPLCSMIARSTGATLAYNAHELETETLGMSRPKKALAKQIERRLISRCALVSVVNDPIADWYEKEYPIRRPIPVGNIPMVRDAATNLREQLGVGAEEMLYIHTGLLVFGRSIPLILDVFAKSPHHIVFLGGDGQLRDQALVAQSKAPNIHVLPPVPYEEIVANVREADVGLCLIEHAEDLSDRLSSPNKLFEYLAAGIPALCSDLEVARAVLGEDSSRWILADHDAELEDAVARITKADVRAFKARWPGLKTWDDEVAPLVNAYLELPRQTPPLTTERRWAKLVVGWRALMRSHFGPSARP